MTVYLVFSSSAYLWQYNLMKHVMQTFFFKCLVKYYFLMDVGFEKEYLLLYHSID
jgi:hypothetical protein